MRAKSTLMAAIYRKVRNFAFDHSFLPFLVSVFASSLTKLSCFCDCVFLFTELRCFSAMTNSIMCTCCYDTHWTCLILYFTIRGIRSGMPAQCLIENTWCGFIWKKHFCLVNSLFILCSNTEFINSLHYGPFVRGIHWWPVNSLHNSQLSITRKGFPCHNVIICFHILIMIITILRWYYYDFLQSLVLANSERRAYSVGEIVNLMAVDSTISSDMFFYLHNCWAAPLNIVGKGYSVPLYCRIKNKSVT